MRKILYLLIVLSVALILAACGTEQAPDISSDTSMKMSSTRITAQSIISKMEGADYKAGELLVKFRSGAAASLDTHQAIGASVKRKFSLVPYLEHVTLPAGASVEDAIVQYMSDPNVAYAEPNYIRKASQLIPNDNYFNQQWALQNTGLFNGTPGADIKAPEAWIITTGLGNITVAVLDTGIDYDHPDLVGNIWINTGEICPNGIDDDLNGYIDDCYAWDFTTCRHFEPIPTVPLVCDPINQKVPGNDPWDDNGHGTHVAGIIGAVGNNGIGITGVIWRVKLMAVKFLNEEGQGDIADEISAIGYAVNNGAHIINASYSGAVFSQAESDAIAIANANGVLFVAAAGNSEANNDITPEYPASYKLNNIVSVAATDQNDRRAPFSNYGISSVHVAAPGVYILSTFPGDLYVGLNQEIIMGTSQAAPHVSGLAALLETYYPHFTIYQIRGTIMRYSDALPTLIGWLYLDPGFVGGRINANRAITSLLTPESLAATALSSSQISLTWNDLATGEAGYKVERKPSGGTYIQITNPPLDQNTTSYTDSGLIDGTTYVYRVRANSIVPNPPDTPWIETNSAYSNEASATTPLNPTTGLTAPPPPSGNGGSCSIGARQNTPTAIADLTVMLIPLLYMIYLRRRR
jgi:subtilisin family serine protease